MRKDLFASLTSKIAVGAAAVLLTAGTGGAVVFSNANHESPGPNDNANVHADENVNDDHESDDQESGDDVTSEDAESNENANNEHGKLVSEAARSDVTSSSNCRNHGEMVSAVARGVTCDDDEPGASPESNGKSDEDHGQSGDEHPPADAGTQSSDDDD